MKGKYYAALRYRKTPTAQRGKYIYEFADGERVTITAADEAVTEVDIRTLHRIRAEEIQTLVAQKGHFPPELPISQYPEKFVRSWLMHNWAQVVKTIEANPEQVPF